MKSFLLGILLVGFICPCSYAVSKTKTTTYPDGRIVVEEEFKGVRGSSSHLAIAVVALSVLGGIVISILGIRMVVKAIQIGSAPEVSELEVDLAQKSLKLKKVSQGVIICLFGAAVILLSVQQLSSLLTNDSGPYKAGSSLPPKFEAGSR